MTSNRFAGIPRGVPLAGPKAIARHVWNDERRWRSAYRLNRHEYGLSIVCGELLGFTGWIEFALAAGTSLKRARRNRKIESQPTA